MAEMAKTEQEAVQMTEEAEGKHHIGDFLPPGELDKFMNKYKVQLDAATSKHIALKILFIAS